MFNIKKEFSVKEELRLSAVLVITASIASSDAISLEQPLRYTLYLQFKKVRTNLQ